MSPLKSMVGSDVCPIDVSFQGCTHVGFQKVDALQDSEAQRRLARLLRGGLRKTDEKGRAFLGSGIDGIGIFRGPPQEPKVTWENRAPKDWQVAFVPWWCRVSPIFLGLFQVMMANPDIQGSLDYVYWGYQTMPIYDASVWVGSRMTPVYLPPPSKGWQIEGVYRIL